MNREVYKHLLGSYGRKPSMWFAVFAELTRTLIGRVYVVILLADIAARITTGDFAGARHYIWIYLGVSVFAIIIAAIGDLFAHNTENIVYGDLQLAYYKKLTTKDMSFYRDNHTGYLTVMMRQYADATILLVRAIKGEMLRMAVSLTMPVIVLFTVSWKIGVLALLLVVFQIVYMVWASSKTKEYRLATHEIYRKISGEVADDVTNIVAYRSAGHELSAQKRMKDLRALELGAYWQRRKIAVLLDTPRAIVTVALIAAAFLIVLSSSDSTATSVKLLILTLTYMFQISRNVTDLPDVIATHDDLMSKMIPTLKTLTLDHETIKDPEHPIAFTPKEANIDMHNVTFSYDSGGSKKYIFKNLNLHINSGEHVGIVGLSGAGKSTLASLLMRFDDVESGEITINNINITAVSQSSLRQHIAFVPQEPVLFHRTIKENIAYHNTEASEADIERAAKAAHAHDFISELPLGYQTMVGERGVKLSGGQKQRVVIARAVLKNAPIILFDEATSALDSESEHIIQQALPAIIGSHTALIIAHRLSTVAGLDRIIVMHDGAIEEQGTHKQLLANKGRYYSLWKKQTNA